MSKDDYFSECVEIAAKECGASLTIEQADYIGGAVAISVENMGMAFSSGATDPHIGRQNEIAALNRELDKERSKIHCRQCDGRGRIITRGPIHSSDSQCWKCRGEGRVLP